MDGVDDVNEGDWRWASNYDEKINATFWARGQPDNQHGDEDCMSTEARFHGLWNDVPCSTQANLICEKEVK